MYVKGENLFMKGKIMVIGIIVLVIIFLAFVGYNIYRQPAMFRELSNNSLNSEQVNALEEEMVLREDKQVLVTYLSHSGTTERVANTLKEEIGADIFEIAPKNEYSNVYIQSNSEVRKGEFPELSNNIKNIDKYDIIFIGYPVWWHATPALINTFLESYDLKGKLVIPFCTSGGSDISETMPTFLDSCNGLAVYGEKKIDNVTQINIWLSELGLNF